MTKITRPERRRLASQVDRILNEIRPYIQSHGGDVKVLEVTQERIARLQLLGACDGCPMSAMTMRMGIERLLADTVPGLKGAEAVPVDDFDLPDIGPKE